MDDSDDAPRALCSQFFCRDNGTPKAATTLVSQPLMIPYDSETLDCGVYCNGITRRHGEDHFYVPRVHRSTGAAFISFKTTQTTHFVHQDDDRFVRASQDQSLRRGHLWNGPRSYRRPSASLLHHQNGRLRRPPTLGSPFLCREDGTPTTPTLRLPGNAGLFCDSQTLDCGVYCRGITRRRDEDQLYGFRLRRFLDAAVIFFNMPTFAHDDEYGFVQDFRDSGDDVAPLECALLFSLTTAMLAVCPRKLSSSQSIRIRFSAFTTDARYRETSSARHTAMVHDIHDVHDDDFRGIATDLVREYKFILIE
ncbi:hypothetical protein EDD18DRAFT_1219764 [Armillaria luteobubalina]|uniref:Uncharacterized protein n=1 Tax=Armillaria luteobubalina TaxID=153913 RepID=A0AA39NZF7_9AGAR|nr:hypothetical protein EDD18DRAFT_1219764 [Armillaria luteobubalina]